MINCGMPVSRWDDKWCRVYSEKAQLITDTEGCVSTCGVYMVLDKLLNENYGGCQRQTHDLQMSKKSWMLKPVYLLRY
jgi:hypothetical protein